MTCAPPAECGVGDRNSETTRRIVHSVNNDKEEVGSPVSTKCQVATEVCDLHKTIECSPAPSHLPQVNSTASATFQPCASFGENAETPHDFQTISNAHRR